MRKTSLFYGVLIAVAGMAVGLVIASRLDLAPSSSAELAPAPALLHASQRDNPAAYGLPLLTALALGEARTLQLPAGPRTHVHLEISNWQN